jgi:predicted metal-dependent peptidase
LVCGGDHPGPTEIGGKKIMTKAKKKRKEQYDIAAQHLEAGYQIVNSHPLFYPLLQAARVRRAADYPCPPNGLACVNSNGNILCNAQRRAAPQEWARAIAHCLLHLGMEHFLKKECPLEWNIACDCVAEKFLSDLKFGALPGARTLPPALTDEEKLYSKLCEKTAKKEYLGFGTAGDSSADMLFCAEPTYRYGKPPQWAKLFAAGLFAAVRGAVNVAAGEQETLCAGAGASANSAACRAKSWFLSSYPLLGALAANFKLIEDTQICQRLDITIAAISPALSEIYINPAYQLDNEEMRFVMAHEFLHAALRHDARQEWRDAYLWNVACDYVINHWLSEMGVGERPDGLMYDEQFKGLSAEAIYERIVCDMRTYRKLATLRGVGVGDILPGQRGPCADVDLDAFYRRALAQGLSYHQEQGRGYLPEGLIEEIRALAHPPIPWDVELARWFDGHFSPIEKTRSYSRPSRRQSATPAIARPSWIISQAALDGRTFGVVLDTSGSMERGLLATALGAIASYSAARDVPAARVVFCDAEAYDAGYLRPADIAGSVKVKGRGGTILQPGIDLLEKSGDFPQEAPILIITDGYCDKVILHGREHAFLIPQGAKLPFVPKGKVFRLK